MKTILINLWFQASVVMKFTQINIINAYQFNAILRFKGQKTCLELGMVFGNSTSLWKITLFYLQITCKMCHIPWGKLWNQRRYTINHEYSMIFSWYAHCIPIYRWPSHRKNHGTLLVDFLSMAPQPSHHLRCLTLALANPPSTAPPDLGSRAPCHCPVGIAHSFWS